MAPQASSRFRPILFLTAAAAVLSSAPSRVAAAGVEAKPPLRIVSLAPSVTEVLFALGVGGKVVAGTRYDDWPLEARSLPKVAGYVDWNLEAILQKEPDLVMGTRELGGEDLARQLAGLGLRAVFVPVFTLDETFASIRAIGDLVGARPEADTLAGGLEGEVRDMREKTKALPKVRVLWVWEREPLITAGPRTFAGEMIDIAGGENASPDLADRFPRLSLEEVLARSPEVILDASMQGKEDPEIVAKTLRYWARWPSIPAVADRRVHAIGSTAFMRPGPRLGLAAREVARLLHPEAFSPPAVPAADAPGAPSTRPATAAAPAPGAP